MMEQIELMAEPKQRKPRSDKGIPKGPKPKGFLTIEQVAHIEKLREAWSEAAGVAMKAEVVRLSAEKAYYDYLNELTEKK